LESPVKVAILPSRLQANFTVTKGVPLVTYLKKGLIQLCSFIGALAGDNFDAGLPEGVFTLAGNQGIGILYREMDLGDAGLNDDLRAGRSTSAVTAGSRVTYSVAPAGFFAGLFLRPLFPRGPSWGLSVSLADDNLIFY
jgi:hypothetical protein